MSINRVAISGNLTRDPDLKRTQSGMAVLSFGVAVNDRRKNQQTGEWEDYANFVDCTMFGARAESVANYISKGSKVSIDGKLRYSSWEKDGQRRSKLEVVVDDIEFMSRRQDGQGRQAGGYAYGNGSAPQQAQGGYEYGQPPQPAPHQQPTQQQWNDQQYAQSQQAPQTSVYDEDIPF